MQHDIHIIAIYFRGMVYRYENPKGGIRLRESLLHQEMIRRKVLQPHPLDPSRGILTFRGERCAKDIVHKMICPLLYIIFRGHGIFLGSSGLGIRFWETKSPYGSRPYQALLSRRAA